MKYAYENLSHTQFEEPIVFLCQELPDISVQGFAQGPDGGRDAKFVGTAERHPSKASPWNGVTIIQAKHTNGYNRNFMESDFFSKDRNSTVIGKETPRIKRLRSNNELDNYMLFANRRLAGNAENEIRGYLAKECNIPEISIYLCGLEQLEIWLKRFPRVAELANIDPVDSPLIVSPDDLAEVVQALAHHRDHLTSALDDPPTQRVPYTVKNALNNMTEAYAKELRKKYLKETAEIHGFLAAPENLGLMHLYEATVDDFQLKIISKRKDYHSFDQTMEYLADILFNRDPFLGDINASPGLSYSICTGIAI